MSPEHQHSRCKSICRNGRNRPLPGSRIERRPSLSMNSPDTRIRARSPPSARAKCCEGGHTASRGIEALYPRSAFANDHSLTAASHCVASNPVSEANGQLPPRQNGRKSHPQTVRSPAASRRRGKWGATNNQLNILDLAIGACRRRLEAGEAIEAGHFSQSMNRDEIPDYREVKPGIRDRPGVAGQRLRVEFRGRAILTDFRTTAGECIEL